MGMQNIGGTDTIKKLIAPNNRVEAAAYSLKGTGIDRSAFDSMLVQVSTGAATGTPDSLTVDAKLQHSDVDTDGEYEDVVADQLNPDVAIEQITDVNQDRFLEINLRPLKKFFRFVFTVDHTGGTTPAVGLSAHAALRPVVGPPVHA